ncbi:DNA-deoxyinosine glycosylase [Caminibacter pacificus]|uniref:DNA-deoxyinosine glycosylase n=1 Tax=Caminibacter pacificus TaxID=1424653 RepID=A0AAJ4UXN7_9BACT|nr:DNA-deoxyinosine glycosylase [Caminibacter pacificus]QCI27948.1 DNA-deoxyinosine glycosylase [Caminibacter pacificus]ROR39873.1 G/U mismatch-specific uracil-DNA glycosylase [Caminibacter pacificus]
MEKLIHPFKPIIFDDSEILILGTFPSIKSFENNFYYSHPKNQFWDILAIIFNDKKPETIEEKIEFLKKHKIALWDSICECKRKEGNSRDDNLEIIKPCNINKLLKQYPNIKKVAVTSRTAEKVIKKHFPNINIIYLTSPSPLNARLKTHQKAEIWKKLLLST